MIFFDDIVTEAAIENETLPVKRLHVHVPVIPTIFPNYKYDNNCHNTNDNYDYHSNNISIKNKSNNNHYNNNSNNNDNEDRNGSNNNNNNYDNYLSTFIDEFVNKLVTLLEISNDLLVLPLISSFIELLIILL